jgi:hypothetical protein
MMNVSGGIIGFFHELDLALYIKRTCYNILISWGDIKHHKTKDPIGGLYNEHKVLFLPDWDCTDNDVWVVAHR